MIVVSNVYEELFTCNGLVQVCPFCDQSILIHERKIVFHAYGIVTLAHDECNKDAMAKRLVTRVEEEEDG